MWALIYPCCVCFSLHVPPPQRTVDFVASCYSTESCKCKLRDIACLKWYVNLFSSLLGVCFSETDSRCELLAQQTSRSWQLIWFSNTVYTCQVVTGMACMILLLLLLYGLISIENSGNDLSLLSEIILHKELAQATVKGNWKRKKFHIMKAPLYPRAFSVVVHRAKTNISQIIAAHQLS